MESRSATASLFCVTSHAKLALPRASIDLFSNNIVFETSFEKLRTPQLNEAIFSKNAVKILPPIYGHIKPHIWSRIIGEQVSFLGAGITCDAEGKYSFSCVIDAYRLTEEAHLSPFRQTNSPSVNHLMPHLFRRGRVCVRGWWRVVRRFVCGGDRCTSRAPVVPRKNGVRRA